MQRVIIIVLAMLVALPIFIRSRERSVHPVPPAAFSVYTSQAILHVLVGGSVKSQGLYQAAANTLTEDAIKMAGLPDGNIRIVADSCSRRYVSSGDHVSLDLNGDGTAVINCGVMSVSQRILLGIPLDINRMTAADFENLPGIGPVLAQRIVEYRQNNGGTMRREDLKLVAGVGEKKYSLLVRYF